MLFLFSIVGKSSFLSGLPASSLSFLSVSCLLRFSCLFIFASVAERYLSWFTSSPALHLCVSWFILCLSIRASDCASSATRVMWSNNCSIRLSVATLSVSSKVSLMLEEFGQSWAFCALLVLWDASLCSGTYLAFGFGRWLSSSWSNVSYKLSSAPVVVGLSLTGLVWWFLSWVDNGSWLFCGAVVCLLVYLS